MTEVSTMGNRENLIFVCPFLVVTRELWVPIAAAASLDRCGFRPGVRVSVFVALGPLSGARDVLERWPLMRGYACFTQKDGVNPPRRKTYYDTTTAAACTMHKWIGFREQRESNFGVQVQQW